MIQYQNSIFAEGTHLNPAENKWSLEQIQKNVLSPSETGVGVANRTWTTGQTCLAVCSSQSCPGAERGLEKCASAIAHYVCKLRLCRCREVKIYGQTCSCSQFTVQTQSWSPPHHHSSVVLQVQVTSSPFQNKGKQMDLRASASSCWTSWAFLRKCRMNSSVCQKTQKAEKTQS